MADTREARGPITNAISFAVYGVFDGAEEAAEACGVTRQAVYLWLGRGLVWNRETALKVEAATAKAGQRVPAAELMALVPWRSLRGGKPILEPARLTTDARGKRRPDAAPANGPTLASRTKPKRPGRKSARFSTTPLPLKVAA